jgi:hypothetical protein
MKLWLACDSRTAYALATDIYVGHQPDQSNRQINVSENFVLDLFKRLNANVLHGRNIVTDRYFTSVPWRTTPSGVPYDNGWHCWITESFRTSVLVSKKKHWREDILFLRVQYIIVIPAKIKETTRASLLINAS